MAFVLSNDPRTKDQFGQDIFPTSTVILPVDKQAVLHNNVSGLDHPAGALNKQGTSKYPVVAAGQENNIVPFMELKMGSQITKSDLILMDMLKTNNWNRPLYIASTVGSSMVRILFEH